LAAGLFTLVVSSIAWWLWWTFQHESFDLAFYVQGLWLALRGEWQVPILEVPILGNHAEPIVFLLTPLFALWPHPMVFIVVQAVALASMPFTAWRIGQALGLDPRANLPLALSTLLAPATGFVALHEFHPEAFSAPFLLLMIEARLRAQLGRFWLWFVATLACKENIAAMLVWYCALQICWDRKQPWPWQRNWNIAPLALASTWLTVYVLKLSPMLNGGNVNYITVYSHLGQSVGDIVRNIFTEPHRLTGALRKAVSHGNLVWGLLLPFLGLSFLRPRWLLVGLPLLVQHLLSWRPSEWSLHFHYGAPFIPLVWMSAVDAISRFRFQRGAAIAVIAACIILQALIGPLAIYSRKLAGWREALWKRKWKVEMIHEVIDNPQLSAVAGMPYLAHLAQRRALYPLHHLLKGLETLSPVIWKPSSLPEVVIVDYADIGTFDKDAGVYHPAVRLEKTGPVPSSDQLLHLFLQNTNWKTASRNEMTVFRRSTSDAPPPLKAMEAAQNPIEIDPSSTLLAWQIINRNSRTFDLECTWKFKYPRRTLAWLSLVLSDGQQLHPIELGLTAPGAKAETVITRWTVTVPPAIPDGEYGLLGAFYDNTRTDLSAALRQGATTANEKVVYLGKWRLAPKH